MTNESARPSAGRRKRPSPLLGRVTAFWSMARPLFLLGTVPLYLLGPAAAFRDGYAVRPWLVAGGLAVIWLVQLATHYNNEYRDFETDMATQVPTRVSGGSRVLIGGVVRPAAARAAGLASLFLAVAFTPVLILVLGAGYGAAALVATAIALGWYYSEPPPSLASRGLGELTIVVATALVTPEVGYYLQTSVLSGRLLLVSMPLWPVIFALRLATELPDIEADRLTGKRTLVVRLGTRTATRIHNVLLSLGWIALVTEAALVSSLTAGVAAAIAAPLLVASLWMSRLWKGEPAISAERMGLIDGFMVGGIAFVICLGLVLT